MRMNSGIILQGQQPDFVNALGRSTQAAQMANENQRQNALATFLQQNGAGVMNGEQNALAQYAQFSPEAALGIQDARLGQDATRLGMDATRQNMAVQTQTQARLSRQEEREIQQHVLSLKAGEAAMQAAEMKSLIASGLQATTPEQWDATVGAAAPELVGQFGNRDVVAGKFLTVAEALERADKQQAGPDPMEALALQRAQIGLDTDIAKLDQLRNPTPDMAAVATTEEGMRKEWNGLATVKDFSTQAQAYNRIVQSSKDDSAAGDLALIFGFMKMLDPASVVRESEFATAQNAAGVPDRVRNAFNNAKDGTRLNPAQRAEFLGIADNIYQGAQTEYIALEGQFREIAKRNGVNPDNVLIDYRLNGGQPNPPAPPALPAPVANPTVPTVRTYDPATRTFR